MESSGGQLLRDLRRNRGETLADIATDAEITFKTLQSIETGSTKSPSFARLSRIVEALDAISPVPIKERHQIFAVYGYRKSYPLPNQREIDGAIQEWKEKYQNVPYPAYLVDCGQRLLDWNKYAPRLVGLRNTDVQTQEFSGVTIYDIMFQISNNFVEMIDREEYFEDLIRTIQSEDSAFHVEDWYQEHLNETRERYPEFGDIWDRVANKDNFEFELGNNIPIKLTIPGTGSVSFRLLKIIFASDARFFVVQWIPVDEFTMIQCLLWVKEESLV